MGSGRASDPSLLLSHCCRECGVEKGLVLEVTPNTMGTEQVPASSGL